MIKGFALVYTQITCLTLQRQWTEFTPYHVEFYPDFQKGAFGGHNFDKHYQAYECMKICMWNV